MTKHPSTSNYTTLGDRLQALFATIPDAALLTSLKTYYAGRRGYTHAVLWHTFIAMYYLNIPSFAALIRMLQDNPDLREACGITNFEGVPSPFAYSRFMRKLAWPRYLVAVKNIMRTLTLQCYDTFPHFGKLVAIDATDLKAWSNGRKIPTSDPDAGWCVKQDTAGQKKFVFGYKAHVLCDVTHELPISIHITKGNVADVKMASPLLGQARKTNGKFHPLYVMADAGYSSDALRRLIRRQYRGEPIVKVNASHKKAVASVIETPDWQNLYNLRTGVERLFGRLKGFRRLNNITVRRRRKVTVHCLLSLIIIQAGALMRPMAPRACVS